MPSLHHHTGSYLAHEEVSWHISEGAAFEQELQVCFFLSAGAVSLGEVKNLRLESYCAVKDAALLIRASCLGPTSWSSLPRTSAGVETKGGRR